MTDGCAMEEGDMLTLLITEKLVLVLRDGRKLIGVLRSWDQFGMSVALLF